MSKFKFIKINKTKKIRYLSVNKYSKYFVVFLHGFMSDLEGSKPKAFTKFCIKMTTSGLTKIPKLLLITNACIVY